MPLSRLAIKNMALAEVPTTRIDDEEDGLAAEVTADIYPAALEELLADYDWDFAVRREPLAATVNAREHEWQYAYALPTDMLRPLRLLPYLATETAVAGSPSYPIAGALRGFEGHVAYRIAGNVLFSTQEAALLEYVSNSPSEGVFTPLFVRALALELAARVVMPINKDSKRQRELIAMAETAKQRAKADAMNRDKETIRDFVPAVQLARLGYGGAL